MREEEASSLAFLEVHESRKDKLSVSHPFPLLLEQRKLELCLGSVWKGTTISLLSQREGSKS